MGKIIEEFVRNSLSFNNRRPKSVKNSQIKFGTYESLQNSNESINFGTIDRKNKSIDMDASRNSLRQKSTSRIDLMGSKDTVLQVDDIEAK